MGGANLELRLIRKAPVDVIFCIRGAIVCNLPNMLLWMARRVKRREPHIV